MTTSTDKTTATEPAVEHAPDAAVAVSAGALHALLAAAGKYAAKDDELAQAIAHFTTE